MSCPGRRRDTLARGSFPKNFPCRGLGSTSEGHHAILESDFEAWGILSDNKISIFCIFQHRRDSSSLAMFYRAQCEVVWCLDRTWVRVGWGQSGLSLWQVVLPLCSWTLYQYTILGLVKFQILRFSDFKNFQHRRDSWSLVELCQVLNQIWWKIRFYKSPGTSWARVRSAYASRWWCCVPEHYSNALVSGSEIIWFSNSRDFQISKIGDFPFSEIDLKCQEFLS